jgi:hypothetical protein
VVIFHVAMSLAYVVAYSAIEERSPSQTLVAHVADFQGKGRTREELVQVLKGLAPVESRLSAMLRDNMVSEIDGVYHLTPKGWKWAKVFSCWRRLLGMGKGG